MSKPSVAARTAKPKGHHGQAPAAKSARLADVAVTFPTYDHTKPPGQRETDVTISGRQLVQLIRVRHHLEKWGSEQEYVCMLLNGLAATLGSYAYEADRDAMVSVPAATLEFADLVIQECALRIPHAQPEDGPTALDYRVEAAVIVGGPR